MKANCFQPLHRECEYERSRSRWPFPASNRRSRRDSRFGRSKSRRGVSRPRRSYSFCLSLLPFSPSFLCFFLVRRLKLTFVIKRVSSFAADLSLATGLLIFDEALICAEKNRRINRNRSRNRRTFEQLHRKK